MVSDGAAIVRRGIRAVVLFLQLVVCCTIVLGNLAIAQNATAAPSDNGEGEGETDAPAAQQQILWYHIAVAVIGLFMLVGGACYVTLMWQQNAIRDYKNSFEALVKKVGLTRHALVESLAQRDDGAVLVGVLPAGDTSTTAPGAKGLSSNDRGDDEPSPGKGLAEVGDDFLGEGRSGPENPSTDLLTGPPSRVGALHAFKMRSLPQAAAAQNRQSATLESHMKRRERELVLEQRRRGQATDVVRQSLAESVDVHRSLTAIERHARWRSLRSLDLAERHPSSSNAPPLPPASVVGSMASPSGSRRGGLAASPPSALDFNGSVAPPRREPSSLSI